MSRDDLDAKWTPDVSASPTSHAARRGRRDHARPVGRGQARRAGAGRSRAPWAIAAAIVAVVVVALGGLMLLGAAGDGTGEAARVPAADASPSPDPSASNDAVPAAVAAGGAAPAATDLPAVDAGAHHSAARVGADGLPVVPAPGSDAPDPSTLTGYAWPLREGRITQPYGPSEYGTLVVGGVLFHDGLDIASFCGDRVRAAHDGVVIAAGRRYDDAIGWLGDLDAYKARNDAKKLWYSLPITIVVDDGNGYRSMYAHLNDIAVTVGDEVTAGQFIGWEGDSGNASGCHLHYGLFSPDESATFALQSKVAAKMKLPATEIARIDPLRVLGRMPKGIEPAETEAPSPPSPSPS